jgi:hypothetical protein
LNFFLCAQISFQEMTIAFLSPSDENSVGTIFEGFEQVDGIHSTGAHDFYYPHVGGIFHSHGTR